MLKIKAGCAALIISSILSGCGGGGGGSSSGSAAPSSTKVAISESNKKQVAAAVLQSNIRSLSAFGENAVGVTPADATASKNWDLIEITKATIGTIALIPGNLSETPTAIVKQGTITCGDEAAPSGSISVEFDDIDGNGEYSARDSVQFTFNDCFDSAIGTTTMGKLKFVFRNVVGQPTKQITPWSIVAELTYSGLQVRDPNRTRLNIGGTMLWSQNQKNVDESSITISDASLIVNLSDKEIVITDCTVTFDENKKTGSYKQFGRQTISNRQLGGVLETEIGESQALVGTNGNAPNSGVVKAVGDKSAVVLSVIGSGSVKIELDSNLDAIIDSDETVDWSSLASY